MLLAKGRPWWFGTVVPAVLLLGLVVTLWQLRHSSAIYPSSWLHRQQQQQPSDPSSTVKPMRPGLQDLSSLPIPPPSPGLRKTIVMGSLARQNTSWVAAELPDWERAIYVTDALEQGIKDVLTVPRNKGNEANVYLHHIIQHYDDLPDVLVFLHSHRDGRQKGWHIDNDMLSNPLSVQHLHLDAVLREGYVSLRCTVFPGCPAGLVLNWNETGEARLPEPPNEIKTVHVMPAAFDIMFPTGLDTPNATADYAASAKHVRPAVIAAPCCAQFAVSKAQILQRPRSDYERYHRWLMASELDNWTSGRVLEYLWHIIFGRPAYWCPNEDKCWAHIYGAPPKTGAVR